MLKKLGVVVISFIATFSVIYATSANLDATGATYASAGGVAGTITPSTRDGITNTPAKSRIYYGTMPSASSYQAAGPIPWEFIVKQDDGGYLLQVYGILDTTYPTTAGAGGALNGNELYTDTAIHLYTKDVNTYLNTLEKEITTSRSSVEGEDNIFTPTLEQFGNGGSLNSKLNSFYRDASFIISDPTDPSVTGIHPSSYFLSSGITHYAIDGVFGFGFSGTPYHPGYAASFASMHPNGNKLGIRPITLLKPSKMVFALEPIGSGTGVTTIDQNSTATMKLRALDETIKIELTEATKNIATAVPNRDIEIGYKNATTGADKNVSALISDEDGNLLYYINYGATKAGENKVTIATTNFDSTKKYYIQLVNETITSDNHPTTSSALTEKIEYKVVNPHKITYTALESTYIYDKDVEEGAKIGSISRTNGVVPIHYELVADGSDTTFNNFEIAGLDEDGNSSEPSLEIKVKGKKASDVPGEPGVSTAPDVVSATNSLKAGTYKFCIVSKDANGDPETDVTADEANRNKVCTSLTVGKATPTISFSDTNQQDLYIGATAYTGEITYSNTDTITSSNITYTTTGGIPNVLTVNVNSSEPKKYDASVVDTYTADGLPTTFTLNAKIAATANYEEATTTTPKSIFVYKELGDLAWSPTKLSYTTDDVTTVGTAVGTLAVKDGVGPFTYALAQSGDTGYISTDATHNSYFSITNGTSVNAGVNANVITTSTLTAGTYKMQFKVSDAKGKTTLVSAVITVNAKAQASIDFVDSSDGVLTNKGIVMNFDNTDTSLLAKGGSTTKAIEYYVAEQEYQPNKIDGTEYLSVNKTNGSLTPKKVGKVMVYAKRPGDIAYADALTSFMEVEIKAAPQKIAFNSATNPNKVEIGKTITEDAKGTLISSNATGIGGIIYKSSDTGIATVDTSGVVTGVASGSVTITATLNDSNSSTYSANYETISCNKAVNVYAGMTLTWKAKSPNLKANSAAIGDSVGKIETTNNDGPVSYKISTNTGITANADGSLFEIVGNNLSADIQLKQAITAASLSDHGNQYHIQVEVTDNNGTKTLDVVVIIDDADNDVYFTENGTKVTSISKKFGESNNAFQLNVNTSNGGNVTYALQSGTTTGVISVLGTGAVSIQGIGTSTVEALVASGSGFSEKKISVQITIAKGEQSISFTDTATLNRQFVKDDTFNEVALLKETSENKASSRVITYASKTSSVCSISSTGTITMLAKGDCEVTATNSDANWTSATTTKKINLYDGMGVSFAQGDEIQAGSPTTQAGAPVGSLSVNGGQGTKTYAVSTSSVAQNKDASFFSVNETGVVSVQKEITASDIAGSYDADKNAYVMYVQFETKDSLANTVVTNAEVKIKGEQLNASFDTGGVGKISKPYSKNGTFTLSLSSNAGNGTPTYQLKNDPAQPSDVLRSVSASGAVVIENANDRSINANPVMVEAIIPPSNGFDGDTIEVVVEIVKGAQPNFGFKNTTINMSFESTITPLFTGKLSTGTTKITSNDASLVKANGNEITSSSTEGTTTITVIDAGDRNYKTATGVARVNITSEPAYGFVISVPSATYGDINVSATILLNDAIGANQVQTWKSSDPTIADVDASGNITIFKAGKVEITCKQTSTGEPAVQSTATLMIKPKAISVQIEDKVKYVGEKNPIFNAILPIDNLVGSDTISQPSFSCLDANKANVNASTPAGVYAITGTYTTGTNPNYNITVKPGKLTIKQDSSKATWYHLEGVTNKTKLDATKWYNQDVKVVLNPSSESAGMYNEISVDKALWDTGSITVTNEDENKKDVYFRVGATDLAHPLAMSTSQATTIKIDKTKPVIKSISGTTTNKDAVSTILNKLTFGAYFKPGTKVSIKSEDILPKPSVKVSGIANVAYEVFEIDKKTGKIDTTAIAHGDSKPNASGISEITLNDVGLYRVCAIATDNAGNQGTQNCSDLNVKNIDVDIDDDGKKDNLDPDNDGCPDIDIVLKNEEEKFYKLNVDRDGDKLPDLNIDSDGDGIADINVDSDNDGLPDLNLLPITKEMWKPTFCVTGQSEEYCTVKELKATINVDVDNDGIPDLNIDNKGDFKAHINITVDGKTAHTNLLKLHEWKPSTNYKKDSFAYDSLGEDKKPSTNIDSDGDGSPDINIDFDNDGIPDINIDGDGDGIPDVNIDGDGDGTPDFNLDPDDNGIPTKNIIVLPSWKPEVNGEKNGSQFDTMEIKKKEVLEDNGLQVEKPGGTFLPNFAIKVKDVTDEIEDKVKDEISNVLSDKELKNVYDVSLWKDNVQVQPDGTLRVKVPYDTSLKNPRVIIELANGAFKEVKATIEDGYLVYDSDYLGRIGIVYDKDNSTVSPDNKDETPSTDNKNPSTDNKTPTINSNNPDTSVKGTYTDGMGGAMTGDTTNLFLYICIGLLSGGYLVYSMKHKQQ